MDFSVQFGTVEQGIAQLEAISRQLTSICDTLRSQIVAGTAEFEGETAARFDAAQRTYDQAHLAVGADVTRSSVALRTIGDTYTGNERTYANAWGG